MKFQNFSFFQKIITSQLIQDHLNIVSLQIPIILTKTPYEINR